MANVSSQIWAIKHKTANMPPQATSAYKESITKTNPEYCLPIFWGSQIWLNWAISSMKDPLDVSKPYFLGQNLADLNPPIGYMFQGYSNIQNEDFQES
jgi:hypothetical protein